MRKRLLVILVILVTGYLGVSSYISSHTKKYLDEIIDAYNRMEYGVTEFTLKEYDEDRAVVRVENLESKEWFDLNTTIEHGPTLSSRATIALLNIEAKKRLTEILSEEDAESLKKFLKRPVEIKYNGVLDFMHIMHEDIVFSKFNIQDNHTKLYVSPISLKSDYVLKNLAGKTTISANRISIKDTKTGGSLDVKKMLIKILIEGSKPKTPIYGEYSIESDDIRFYETPTDGVHIHMASKLDVKVKKVTDKYSDIEFKISAQAKDETTEENWLGIKSLNLEVSMKNLGVEGMQEIYKVQEEQNKIQARLQKALIDKDDVAMQKSIIEMQRLESAWVTVYNKLLIKNNTRFTIKKIVEAEKKNHIFIDLLFTGDKLSGDNIGAMVALGANVDKLFKGDVDIAIQKSIVEKLHRESIFLLDNMVKKRLAEFKDGLYIFKAKIENGKIIVNGTEYSPQEFAMTILI
jgi:hypothetical protein